LQTNIRKWGNGLAVRIPKQIADELGVDEDAPIELTVEGGQIILRPLLKVSYDLNDLVAGITEDNLHGETQTGPPQGEESW